MDDLLFRSAMGKFATGVTVVTTQDGEEIAGMTANAFMSVSLDPKLVTVSIGHHAKCLQKIQGAGKFAVNVLAEDQIHYSKIFAGQLEGEVEFNTLSGVPVLEGALAQVVCEIVSEHVEGDHTLLIGKVIDLNVSEGEPLVFSGGRYRNLA